MVVWCAASLLASAVHVHVGRDVVSAVTVLAPPGQSAGNDTSHLQSAGCHTYTHGPVLDETQWVPPPPRYMDDGQPNTGSITIGPNFLVKHASQQQAAKQVGELSTSEDADTHVDVLFVLDPTPIVLAAGPAQMRHWCEFAITHANLMLQNSGIVTPLEVAQEKGKRFALAGCHLLPFNITRDPLGRDFFLIATSSHYFTALREHYRADIISFICTHATATESKPRRLAAEIVAADKLRAEIVHTVRVWCGREC